MAWEIVVAAAKAIDLFKVLLLRAKDSDVFTDVGEIVDISKEIVYGGLSIDCFLIVKVHDGNSKLSPHNFMYWSVVGGKWNDVLMKRFERKNYIKVLVDEDYAALFANIKKHREYSTKIEYIHPGPMRTSYEFEGIKFCKFFILKHTKKAMWFIVAGTTAPNETFTGVGQTQKLNVAVNKVKVILSKY